MHSGVIVVWPKDPKGIDSKNIWREYGVYAKNQLINSAEDLRGALWVTKQSAEGQKTLEGGCHDQGIATLTPPLKAQGRHCG